jgi:hypothetical protein
MRKKNNINFADSLVARKKCFVVNQFRLVDYTTYVIILVFKNVTIDALFMKEFLENKNHYKLINLSS